MDPGEIRPRGRDSRLSLIKREQRQNMQIIFLLKGGLHVKSK